jgi:hypothetical protein
MIMECKIEREDVTGLLSACEFALEYLEANEGEYGTHERIKACQGAISSFEWWTAEKQNIGSSK